jgi:hypothetical protein
MSEIYFTFPVAVLAYDESERRSAAVYYAMMLYGERCHASLTTEDRETVREYCGERSIPAPEGDNGYRFVLGAVGLGVKIGPETEDCLSTLYEFKRWMNGMELGRVLVRIRRDLFWDWHKRRMPDRRFAVLCAIYSRIGAKPWAKITVADVRRMAAGVFTRDDAERYNAGEIEAGEILTPDQIRTTIKGLVADSLVTRFTFNRGETFYSHPKKHPTTASLALTILRGKAKRKGMERETAKAADLKQLEEFLKAYKARLANPNVYNGNPNVIPTPPQGDPNVVPTYIEASIDKPSVDNPLIENLTNTTAPPKGGAGGVVFDSSSSDLSGEEGWLIDGRFLTANEMTAMAVKAAEKNPDAILCIAAIRKPAIRKPDGEVVAAEGP